jgi:hypothetical protein
MSRIDVSKKSDSQLELSTENIDTRKFGDTTIAILASSNAMTSVRGVDGPRQKSRKLKNPLNSTKLNADIMQQQEFKSRCWAIFKSISSMNKDRSLVMPIHSLSDALQKTYMIPNTDFLNKQLENLDSYITNKEMCVGWVTFWNIAFAIVKGESLLSATTLIKESLPRLDKNDADNSS